MTSWLAIVPQDVRGMIQDYIHGDDHFTFTYTIGTPNAIAHCDQIAHEFFANHLPTYVESLPGETLVDKYATHLRAYSAAMHICACDPRNYKCVQSHVVAKVLAGRTRLALAISGWSWVSQPPPTLADEFAIGEPLCPRIGLALCADMPELLTASEICALVCLQSQYMYDEHANISAIADALRGRVPCPYASVRTRDGYTPLMILASDGRYAIIEQVYTRAHVDINAQDAGGRTALHHVCARCLSGNLTNATKYRFSRTIRALITILGANTHVRDNLGNTAFAYLYVCNSQIAHEVDKDTDGVACTIGELFLRRGHVLGELYSFRRGAERRLCALPIAVCVTSFDCSLLWNRITNDIHDNIDITTCNDYGETIIDMLTTRKYISSCVDTYSRQLEILRRLEQRHGMPLTQRIDPVDPTYPQSYYEMSDLRRSIAHTALIQLMHDCPLFRHYFGNNLGRRDVVRAFTHR